MKKFDDGFAEQLSAARAELRRCVNSGEKTEEADAAMETLRRLASESCDTALAFEEQRWNIAVNRLK